MQIVKKERHPFQRTDQNRSADGGDLLRPAAPVPAFAVAGIHLPKLRTLRGGYQSGPLQGCGVHGGQGLQLLRQGRRSLLGLVFLGPYVDDGSARIAEGGLCGHSHGLASAAADQDRGYPLLHDRHPFRYSSGIRDVSGKCKSVEPRSTPKIDRG